jgi:hypothetical protein
MWLFLDAGHASRRRGSKLFLSSPVGHFFPKILLKISKTVILLKDFHVK